MQSWDVLKKVAARIRITGGITPPGEFESSRRPV